MNATGSRAHETIRIPTPLLSSNPLTRWLQRFVGAHSDAPLVDALRRCSEGAYLLLHSENHNARTNGEYRVVDCLDNVGVALDVGSNRGNWTASVVERHPDARVYCFELAAPTRTRLHARFDEQPNVTVMDYGLSDQRGQVPTKYYPGDDRLSSLYDYPHPLASSTLSERVERGDDVLESHGIEHVDILKIDAEGADLAVLKGFKRTLAGAGITAIQFEYGFACVLARAFLLDFYELLGANGYRIGRVCSRSVKFGPYRLEAENFCGPNFLAVHESASDLIQRLSMPSWRFRHGPSRRP